MPLYEYRCTTCGYSFEKIQHFSTEPESVCPKCQGVLIRPVTAPAIQFKGSGWYVNDYAAKGKSRSSEATSESAAENPSSAEVKTPAAESTSAPTPAPAPAASSTPAAT